MEEIFLDVKGYEGLYQVSNLGNVKSLVNNKCVEREKILKPVNIGNGYVRVMLCKNKTNKLYLVHRLVAQAFIENPTNLPCINHIDENKQNNSVENLEWCTHKYNCNFGTRNERAGKAISNNTNRSKEISKALSKKVYQYSKDLELISVWKSTQEAQRQGFNSGHISACCNGKLKTHKGYIWSYTPLIQ